MYLQRLQSPVRTGSCQSPAFLAKDPQSRWSYIFGQGEPPLSSLNQVEVLNSMIFNGFVQFGVDHLYSLNVHLEGSA